jgi:hypothetical protein
MILIGLVMRPLFGPAGSAAPVIGCVHRLTPAMGAALFAS